jgi:hypothetical protein
MLGEHGEECPIEQVEKRHPIKFLSNAGIFLNQGRKEGRRARRTIVSPAKEPDERFAAVMVKAVRSRL